MEKQNAMKRIELVETFFEKANSEDEYGELAYIRRKYKVIKTQGLDVAQMMQLGGSEMVVKSIKDYLAKTYDDTEIIIYQASKGVPLTNEDKVEMAKYHHALQWLCVFWR